MKISSLYAKRKIAGFKYVEYQDIKLSSCSICHLFKDSRCPTADCHGGYFVRLSKIDMAFDAVEEAKKWLENNLYDNVSLCLPQTGREVFKPFGKEEKEQKEEKMSLGRQNEYDREMAARYARRGYGREE